MTFLTNNVHFTEFLGKELAGAGILFFDVAAVDGGGNPVKVNAIGQQVAVFIFSIPGIGADISADMDGTEFVLVNFFYDLSTDGHDLDSESCRNLRSGEYKNKSCRGGEWVGPVHYFGDGRFVDHFKADLVVDIARFVV